MGSILSDLFFRQSRRFIRGAQKRAFKHAVNHVVETLERRAYLTADPTVSIYAYPQAGQEVEAPGAPVAAQFLVKRTGDLSAPLTVALSSSGTAMSGTDYIALPSSVVFPVGADSAVVSIVPIDDYLIEGDESVTATVAAPPGYTVPIDSAQVVIKDDDSVDSDEPNDSFATATRLTAGTTYTALRRSLDTATDQDYFTFDTLGKGLRVSTSHNAALNSIRVDVYNASHNLIGQSAVAGNQQSVLLPDAPAGTYFARVYSVDGPNPHFSLTVDSRKPYLPATSPAPAYPVVAFDQSADIKAENFDQGGQGISFNDTTDANTGNYSSRGGSLYGVDMRQYFPASAPHTLRTVVTDTHAGEWLDYSVMVQTAATYSLTALLGNTESGGQFHLEVDGVPLSGPVAVPNAGSFELVQGVAATASLSVGMHIARIVFDAEPSSGIAGEFQKISIAPVIPAVGFASSTYDAHEPESGSSALNYEFDVQRFGSTDTDLVVHYTVTGTMTPGEDYTPPSGVLTIPAGMGSAPIFIPILPDTKYEPTETLIIALEPVAGANLATNGMLTVNVADFVPQNISEPNNSIASATNLGGIDLSINGAGALPAGDVDYFRATPMKDDGQLTATLSFRRQDGQLSLIAYDSDGVEIARSELAGDSETVSFPTSTEDACYFEVIGKDGASNGHYTLNVQWGETIPPTIEFLPVPESTVNGGEGAIGYISFVSSEPVLGFDIDDLRLTRNGVPVPLSGPDLRITGGQVQYMAPFTAIGGNYVLTVPAATSGITDLYGNAMVQDASVSWINDIGVSGRPVALPLADTYDQAGASAETNFGGASQLVVGPGSGTDTSEAFFKFDIGMLDPDANEEQATFRIYGHATSDTVDVPLAIYPVADNSWSETGLTYNNRPVIAASAFYSFTTNRTDDSWYDFDVSDYVRQQKAAGATTVSFVLQTAVGDAGTFVASSREGANAPQLVHVERYPHLVAQFSSDQVTVPEGESAAVGVTLNRAPNQAVTVQVASSGGDQDLQPTTQYLTFDNSNWATPQPLTFTAAEDADAIQGFAGFYAVILSLPGRSDDLAVSEQDNDFASETDTTNPGTDLTVSDGTSTRAVSTNDTQLTVRKSNTTGQSREAYLKFDLTKVASASDIQSAKVRLWGKLSAAGNLSVGLFAVTKSNWSPSGLNWATRPPTTATALASRTVSGAAGAWYEFDVTSYLKTQKLAGATTVSFALKAGVAGALSAIFNSFEATTNRPVLSVVRKTVLPPESLVISTSVLAVKEGGSSTFTVKLAAQPQKNVVIQITQTGDPDLVSSRTQLTFTPSNWNTAQVITVSDAQDADALDGKATFSVWTPGLLARAIVATEIEDDGLSKAPASHTLSPKADAYVRNGTYAAKNYGTSTDLVIKKDTVAGSSRNAIFQFDLSSVATITSGKLRLFAHLGSAGGAVGINIYSSATQSWTESGVNWNNQPVAGVSILKSFSVAGTAAAWYDIDLTAFLKAEKAAGRNKVTLVLKAAQVVPQTVILNSDESVTGRPVLSLT